MVVDQPRLNREIVKVDLIVHVESPHLHVHNVAIHRLHAIDLEQRHGHAAAALAGHTEVRYADIRMSELSRIGVAIDSTLLENFDDLIARRGYTNRSEAFRDLIRDALIEQTARRPDSIVVGTLTLVYDHRVRMLSERLTGMQHEHFHSVLSTLHVHLDHDNCLEVLVLKGKTRAVQKMADALISTKGVKHGRLTITSTGAGL